MAQKPASLETLLELHELFAKQLIKDLNAAHYVDEDGKEHLPASLYTVIDRFLKNNGIDKDVQYKDKSKDPVANLGRRFASIDPDDDTEFDKDTGDDIPIV